MRILAISLAMLTGLMLKPAVAADEAKTTSETTTTSETAAHVDTDHLSTTDAGHMHGSKDCKHKKVSHAGHTDYIHDGEYHAVHADHFDTHGLVANAASKGEDTLTVANHDHKHGAKCGHKAVKHGNHTDYDHDGHLHAAHMDHVDDHGPSQTHLSE